MPTGDFVIDHWRCICEAEREADVEMATASIGMSGFVFKDTITAIFEDFSPSWAGRRRDVWSNAMDVEESTVIIGETEYEVYLTNRTWMSDLAAALFLGEVALSNPYCLILNFYDRALTIPSP